ncbi:hypothetical protein CYMTET_6373 [Cymbomonas tetramitiformis]|uniref:Uncharacterized protein n=1 Tax=Cymbomonas tetramitiformis TaxID=36881 RepID=A0AAE0GX75_9CHLO|nr:hypothetical protein CYMTET_6373 [Cymbomonas tetramitiformis]
MAPTVEDGGDAQALTSMKRCLSSRGFQPVHPQGGRSVTTLTGRFSLAPRCGLATRCGVAGRFSLAPRCGLASRCGVADKPSSPKSCSGCPSRLSHGSPQCRLRGVQERMRGIFRAEDRFDSGSLDSAEICQVLRNVQPGVHEQLLEYFQAMLDVDGLRMFSFEELSQVVHESASVAEGMQGSAALEDGDPLCLLARAVQSNAARAQRVFWELGERDTPGTISAGDAALLVKHFVPHATQQDVRHALIKLCALGLQRLDFAALRQMIEALPLPMIHSAPSDAKHLADADQPGRQAVAISSLACPRKARYSDELESEYERDFEDLSVISEDGLIDDVSVEEEIACNDEKENVGIESLG